MSLKAIETVYKGYRFRSRLEARWAVFFDSLALRFEYEKQGYDLGGLCYLPDFWLPDEGSWFEVKGLWPNSVDRLKMRRLAIDSQRPVFFTLNGVLEPPETQPDGSPITTRGSWLRSMYSTGTSSGDWPDVPTCFSTCVVCHELLIPGSTHYTRHEELCHGRQWNPRTPKLLRAYEAARQARFDGKPAGFFYVPGPAVAR